MKSQLKKVGFFYRSKNKTASGWADKIKRYIKKKYPARQRANAYSFKDRSLSVGAGPRVSIVKNNPDVLIVLGGDGTILEAARKNHHRSNPMLFGLNLGHVGFLASVRNSNNFLKSIDQFLKGKFSLSERVILNAQVIRSGKRVFSGEVLNEVIIQNVLGMVDLEVAVGNTNIRKIRGSGVIVATATGSTAFNLSAHGPIVMPNIKCLIITEIMDHNVPTPSIVVEYNEEVTVKINSFRQKGTLSISKTKKKADVVLVADGDKIFPLEKGDMIKIKNSNHLVQLVEVEPNYFFKSLKDKFSVR